MYSAFGCADGAYSNSKVGIYSVKRGILYERERSKRYGLLPKKYLPAGTYGPADCLPGVPRKYKEE